MISEKTFIPPAPLTTLKWYAVDFDNTLCVSKYVPGDANMIPGIPIEENIKKLHEVIDAGFGVIIHTSRHWGDYKLIKAWLEHYDVPFTAIVCGKILAHRYVDDRAISAEAISWL